MTQYLVDAKNDQGDREDDTADDEEYEVALRRNGAVTAAPTPKTVAFRVIVALPIAGAVTQPNFVAVQVANKGPRTTLGAVEPPEAHATGAQVVVPTNAMVGTDVIDTPRTLLGAIHPPVPRLAVARPVVKTSAIERARVVGTARTLDGAIVACEAEVASTGAVSASTEVAARVRFRTRTSEVTAGAREADGTHALARVVAQSPPRADGVDPVLDTGARSFTSAAFVTLPTHTERGGSGLNDTVSVHVARVTNTTGTFIVAHGATVARLTLAHPVLGASSVRRTRSHQAPTRRQCERVVRPGSDGEDVATLHAHHSRWLQPLCLVSKPEHPEIVVPRGVKFAVVRDEEGDALPRPRPDDSCHARRDSLGNKSVVQIVQSKLAKVVRAPREDRAALGDGDGVVVTSADEGDVGIEEPSDKNRDLAIENVSMAQLPTVIVAPRIRIAMICEAECVIAAALDLDRCFPFQLHQRDWEVSLRVVSYTQLAMGVVPPHPHLARVREDSHMVAAGRQLVNAQSHQRRYKHRHVPIPFLANPLQLHVDAVGYSKLTPLVGSPCVDIARG